MTDAEIAALASRIADGSLLSNWRSYLLFGAIALVAAAAGNFIAGYVRKRGENFATKADFNTLLDQLRKTTNATEEIRQRLSHDTWLDQQARITNRTKLEELLGAVFEIHLWLDHEKDHVLFEGPANTVPDPTYKIEILEALYFRDLANEIRQVHRAALDYKRWILRHKVPLLTARLRKDSKAQVDTLQSAIGQYEGVYQPLLQSTSALASRATAAMAQALRRDDSQIAGAQP